MGIKNAEFYADFKFVDAEVNKKLQPKNYANFEYFRFIAIFFSWFFAFYFLEAFFKASINNFEILN